MKRTLPALLMAVCLVAAACGSTGTGPASAAIGPTASAEVSAGARSTSSAVPSATATGSAAVNASPSIVPDDTVWLCKPGLANDPCTTNLDSAVVAASGKTTVEHAAAAADPPIDCFYVYPTVSRQTGTNATLTIDPEERAVAVAQAARFSQVCKVYAPMYPQLTLAAISKAGGISLLGALIAFNSVDASFRDYLANYNHGRGIVFIGHSQGAAMLVALLRGEVDPNPAVRRLLVSALLMGGNVAVPVGKTVGGDFANIPACASTTQIGCVVAYSTFDRTPPANSFFGRTTSGLNPFHPTSTVPLAILCVNPAAPGGGAAPLLPYFPTRELSTLVQGAAAPSTPEPFIAYPGEYSAHCATKGGATWLQVDRTGGAADVRPVLTVNEPATWGLHVVDVNVALGNLVNLVRSESAAYH
jgi:Protein of unknown function (DUF3089)